MRVHNFARVVVIAAAMAGALLSPFSVATANPSDPKCWPKDQQAQCTKLKGYFDEKDIANGGSSECSPGWLQCFSGNKPIDIAIKIGDVGQVKNLGEYIRLIYVWLIPVGAILAAVVIMIGGIVWLTSGGAERLSTAKQWIGNAIIGLLLLLLSYVILNTINPDLVRLQMPRTQILRAISAAVQPCGALGSTVLVFSEDTHSSLVRSESQECGKTYYPKGVTQKTCTGSACPTGKPSCTIEGGVMECR